MGLQQLLVVWLVHAVPGGLGQQELGQRGRVAQLLRVVQFEGQPFVENSWDLPGEQRQGVVRQPAGAQLREAQLQRGVQQQLVVQQQPEVGLQH